MENPIFYVERIMWLLKRGELDEQSIRRAGELMGMPTRRADALRARYPRCSLGLLRRGVVRLILNTVCVSIPGIERGPSKLFQYRYMQLEQ
jgi:hypothetical protein